MPLRTPQQYIESLRDGRRVFFRGEQVADVTTHPEMSKAVAHTAIDYRMAEDPRWRHLMVVGDKANAYSRYYHLPQSGDDLLARSHMIEAETAEGGTVVVLIKEIGSDALFALHRVASALDKEKGTEYLPRVETFYRYCRDNDLAVAVAQTDAKGDRRNGPSRQSHPDYYVRVVERRDDGIVVRGAKCHTSVSVNANEVVVLPTRSMGPDDEDYAVSFAVPVNTPGLTLISSPYLSGERNSFENPVSARHKMMETVTVFEDVFVPWERVFLCGEWEFAGELALRFVEYHRFTAVSYKLPLLDLFVGAGKLIAEMNGVGTAVHVREKVTWLIAYAETTRALIHAAAQECHTDAGIAFPDPLLTNMAKLHFASKYHEAIHHLQDLAGGLLVTAPGLEDWEHPELGKMLGRYLGGATGTARERASLLNLISDLTASDLGGYHAVLAVHAEGSIEAEKMMVYRSYDPERAVAYAQKLAGISKL